MKIEDNIVNMTNKGVTTMKIKENIVSMIDKGVTNEEDKREYAYGECDCQRGYRIVQFSKQS